MDLLAARPFVSLLANGCSPAGFARHPRGKVEPCTGGSLRQAIRLVRANATRPRRSAKSPPTRDSPASACSENRAQDDLPRAGRAILRAVSGGTVSWARCQKHSTEAQCNLEYGA